MKCFGPVSRVILSASALLGTLLLGGCWGSGNSVGGLQFLYAANGSAIREYQILPNGSLGALNPPTAPGASPYALTTSANHLYVYSTNRQSGSVGQYAIGFNGQLTPLNPATVPSGASPADIVATKNGKYVYAINNGDGTISQYSEALDGHLTPLNPPTVSVASDGAGLGVTPDSKYLYAASYGSNKISAYSIGTNGQLTPLAVPTYDVTGPNVITISPDGSHLYVPTSTNGIAQFSIAADGSLTPLNPANASSPGVGNDTMSITPDGRFGYVGVFNGGFAGSPVAQYSIGGDGTLSALNPVSVPAGNAPFCTAIERTGTFIYVSNYNDGTIYTFGINGNGTLIQVGSPVNVQGSGAEIVIVSF